MHGESGSGSVSLGVGVVDPQDGDAVDAVGDDVVGSADGGDEDSDGSVVGSS
ncbi:MAG: hypothetical protein ACRDQ7_14740 [Haloechinothrix sp.]